MDRGPKCWVTIFPQRIDPMLIQEIFLDTIIMIMKRKEKPTGWWQARNTHLCKQVVLSRIFKRMVPVLVHSFLRKRMFSFIFMKSHG